jgi:thiol:disulfide interchange protein DsbC
MAPMKTRTRIGFLTLVLAATTHAHAVPGVPPEADDLKALLAGIEALQRLPVTGLQMIRAGGQLWYISANGRYAFQGQAWDLWHGVKLDGLDQAARLAERIDLQRMHLDPADLGAMDLGAGPQVLVFVDPLCPHCQGLLRALRTLTERYRFRVILLPALGKDSQTAVLRLSCLAQTAGADAALAALIAHAPVPEVTAACTQQAIQRTLVTAQILGIGGVPFLIAPDGRMRQGEPPDLAAWLEGQP